MPSLSVLPEKPLEIRLGDGEKPRCEKCVAIAKTHPRDCRDFKKKERVDFIL